MKDETGGDARLILRRAVHMRVDAVDLKDANSNKRRNVPIKAAAESASPRSA